MSQSLDSHDSQRYPDGVFLDEDDGDETKIDSRFAPCFPVEHQQSLHGFETGFESDFESTTFISQLNSLVHRSLEPTDLTKLPFRSWNPNSSDPRSLPYRPKLKPPHVRHELRLKADSVRPNKKVTVNDGSKHRIKESTEVVNTPSPIGTPDPHDVVYPVPGLAKNTRAPLLPSPEVISDNAAAVRTTDRLNFNWKRRNNQPVKTLRSKAVAKKHLRRSMINWAATQDRKCAIRALISSANLSQSAKESLTQDHLRCPASHRIIRGLLGKRAESSDDRWESDFMAATQLVPSRQQTLSEVPESLLFTRRGWTLQEQLLSTRFLQYQSSMKSFTKNAGGTASSTSKSAAASTSSSQTSTPEKRKSSYEARNFRNRNQEDGNADSDEDEQQTPSKRSKNDPNPNTPHIRLLACPYWKFDPARYSEHNRIEKNYRGCSSCYLTDIVRLKQHLYRVHQRPKNQCPRCSTLFQNPQELDAHVRATVACETHEPAFPERFSESQHKELKRRWPRESFTESWMRIWRILFPGARCPDSPYLEASAETISSTPIQTDDVFDFIADFRAKAPAILQEILQELAQPHQPAELSDWLKSREASSVLDQSIERLIRQIAPSLSASAPRHLHPSRSDRFAAR